MSDVIKSLACGWCGSPAEAKYTKGSGKIFVNCSCCGFSWFNKNTGQVFIKNLLGITGKPAQDNSQAPAQETQPETIQGKAQDNGALSEIIKVVNQAPAQEQAPEQAPVVMIKGIGDMEL